MVGGDRVAEDAERPGALNLAHPTGLQAELREEGRLLDIGGVRIPRVNVAGGGRHFVPFRVLGRKVPVEPPKHVGLERGLQLVADFLKGGPDVAQEYRLAVLALAQGFMAEVDVNPAGDRKCDHQRRRHEKVGLDALVHPRLEVAVARQHRGRHEIVLHHGVFDRRMQRARVANARGASVADRLESELVEIRRQTGLVEVVGHHPRAGRERGFD